MTVTTEAINLVKLDNIAPNKVLLLEFALAPPSETRFQHVLITRRIVARWCVKNPEEAGSDNLDARLIDVPEDWFINELSSFDSLAIIS